MNPRRDGRPGGAQPELGPAHRRSASSPLLAVRHPRLARRSAVASMPSSWPPELKVPFARAVPDRSRTTAYGLPGIASASQTSASDRSSKPSTETNGSPASQATAGSSARQTGQPVGGEHCKDERGVSGGDEALDQGDGLVQRRPLVGELERELRAEAQPQDADLPREAEHSRGPGRRGRPARRRVRRRASRPPRPGRRGPGGGRRRRDRARRFARARRGRRSTGRRSRRTAIPHRRGG